MLGNRFIKESFYYFARLPLFSFRLFKGKFQTIEDALEMCPVRPKSEAYYNAILKACATYPFLKEGNPEKLSALYNLISAVREADVYTFPFLNKKTLASFNEFHNLDALSAACEKGPVLILYAHTGSYYQTIAATGMLGYKIYPIAYGVDLSDMERPFNWFLSLNMRLSERHFSGGHYLYTNTPSFAASLKKILSEKEKSVLCAAIDLPQSFITQKRSQVDFLGGMAAFPDRLIYTFARLKLPILTAFPWINIAENRVKRFISYEKVPDSLSSQEILQLYAYKLGEFIKNKPEQIITLVNLEGFFA